MAYSGVISDFHKAIALKQPERVPVVACSEEFDVRVCGGGINYNQYNRDARIMAQTQIAAVRRFDYDWAWLQVDDCIVFEVLGVEVKGEGDILPATCGYLPPVRASLNSLRLPNPQKDGRMPILLEAIKRVKDELGDEVIVCGRTEAPFSSACLLYGIEETMLMMLTDPELLMDTMNFMAELQSDYGVAQKLAGADAVWFGDCNASSHLMGPRHYTEFAAPYAHKVADVYKQAGLHSIYHASEENLEHLKIQASIGFSALSIGPGLDIAIAKAAVGDNICLFGNIDPVNILMRGTVEQTELEAARIINAGRVGGGYIFNTGEMVPRDTPIENMEAMLRSAHIYAQ